MAARLTNIIAVGSLVVLLFLTLCLVDLRWSTAEYTLATILPIMLIMVLVVILCNKNHIKWSVSDVLIVLYVAYYFVRIYFGAEYPCSTTILKSCIMLLLYVVLRILFAYSNQKKLLHNILVVGIIFCGCIESVWGLLQLFSDTGRHARFVFLGSFLNPGPYSAYLATAIAVAIAWNPTNDKHIASRKWMITLMSIVLICTWSRAALSAVLIIFLWHFRESYQKHRFWVWTIAILLVFILYAVKRDSADGRLLIWYASLLSWMKHPLFGVGIGGFQKAYSDGLALLYQKSFSKDMLMSADVAEYAFNEIIKVLVEQGLLGLLFIVGIMWVIVRCLHKNSKPLFYGMMALFIFSIFSYPMAQFPYRVLLVLFAAYAGSEIEHTIISIRGKAVLAICVICLLPISYGVYRQVDIRKKMDSEYHLFSHMNDAVFIQDYYDLYPYGQDSPDYLFQFAKLLQSQGRYTDSNAILRQGTLLSCDPMFYVLMGNNYVHMEFYQEAENAYMEAHCRMPNRLYPLYQLMLLYSQIGDEEKAESMAIRLLNKKEKITSPATIEMKDRAKALLNKDLDE